MVRGRGTPLQLAPAPPPAQLTDRAPERPLVLRSPRDILVRLLVNLTLPPPSCLALLLPRRLPFALAPPCALLLLLLEPTLGSLLLALFEAI